MGSGTDLPFSTQDLMFQTIMLGFKTLVRSRIDFLSFKFCQYTFLVEKTILAAELKSLKPVML